MSCTSGCCVTVPIIEFLTAAAPQDCFPFFFSCRRRHTRSLRDWSSDVCSSDLTLLLLPARPAPAQGFDSTVFAALKWREIGIYRGGRSVAVAGSASRVGEFWMGTTGGGVFKTTDGGDTWTPVTDKYFGGTIGAIGVSESNPDI